MGFILYQVNVPSHNALSVKQFLSSKNIAVLAHPLVYLILLPATSSFFPKIRFMLKGTLYIAVEKVRAKNNIAVELSYRK